MPCRWPLLFIKLLFNEMGQRHRKTLSFYLRPTKSALTALESGSLDSGGAASGFETIPLVKLKIREL